MSAGMIANISFVSSRFLQFYNLSMSNLLLEINKRGVLKLSSIYSFSSESVIAR